MPGKRLTLEEDGKILRLREAGKTYKQIVELTGHGNHTVWRVLHGRPKERKPRGEAKRCCECGTSGGPFFHRGGGLRCVKCAALTVGRAQGRKV